MSLGPKESVQSQSSFLRGKIVNSPNYLEKKTQLGFQIIGYNFSPWSAPAWMKSNNEFYGRGHLLEEYYQAWADYFVRFSILLI